MKIPRMFRKLRLVQKCIVCNDEILISKEKVQLKCCRTRYHVVCLIEHIARQQRTLVENGVVSEDQDVPTDVACPMAACDQIMDEYFLRKLREQFPEIWQHRLRPEEDR